MANQSAAEDEKTSKPLVGNFGAQTEETENGPEKKLILEPKAKKKRKDLDYLVKLLEW